MSDLRKYLRLQNKYGRYCEFKKRVLTPVQEELKEKSATNSSDFSFDYTEEYAPGVRRTGEPLYLNFKINVSSTFVDNHEQELLKSQQRYIYDILRSKSLLLQEEKASEISSMVTLENYQRISMRIQSVNEKFMEKNDIKDKRSYLYKSLINEIEEKDDPVDE